MKFGIKTIDDFDFSGKTVLCRIDINEPIDMQTSTLKDDTRIRECAPTIAELSDKGAKVVLLAHQGSDIEYKNFFSTKPHASALEKYCNKPVEFIDDVCGIYARERIQSMKNGEIILLDNVRNIAEEQTLFEINLKLSGERQANTYLPKKLAPLADIFVLDAFSAAHRDQPSICGLPYLLPSCMGRLFEKEYSVLSSLTETPPTLPCLCLAVQKLPTLLK